VVEFITIAVGPLDVNCTIVVNRNINEGFLVDPGGNIAEVKKVVDENKIKVKGIFFTHGHFDHIWGAVDVPSFFNDSLTIGMHTADSFLWDNLSEQLKRFGFHASLEKRPGINFWLKEGQFTFCDIDFEILHTPGHSPGSCSFYFFDEKQPFLIAGDVIFKGSIGRTDLWGGDYNTLIGSIQSKILNLPEQTRIISGHGPDTTVGDEKRDNPYLGG